MTHEYFAAGSSVYKINEINQYALRDGLKIPCIFCKDKTTEFLPQMGFLFKTLFESLINNQLAVSGLLSQEQTQTNLTAFVLDFISAKENTSFCNGPFF